MAQIKIDLSKKGGIVKPMNAVNNGPAGSVVRGTSNMEYFRAAGIPYARNHDAAFSGYYGGEYSVDVHRIFPDFDADENDPASYLFGPTDAYVRSTHDAGTEMFYRLGAAIEHGYKKGTYPPKDFAKWARIAEHIIRHYTEGWADGMHERITYWEIWNEPDTRNADGSKPCWQGTEEQFVDFYCVVAKHLKQCFPHLKIGGPAFCSVWASEKFIRKFLAGVKETGAALDFFSYHCYGNTPKNLAETIDKANGILADCGVKTETNLNEWNYIKGWMNDEWRYSLRMEKGLKGASFTLGCMCAGQVKDLDMLTYYDARPCGMNGMFDTDTLRPLKGYYPFLAFRELRDLGTALWQDAYAVDGIYYTAATNGTDSAAVFTHYDDSDDDTAAPRDVEITFQNNKGKVRVDVYVLDEAHDLVKTRSEVFTGEEFSLFTTMPLYTSLLVKVTAI